LVELDELKDIVTANAVDNLLAVRLTCVSSQVEAGALLLLGGLSQSAYDLMSRRGLMLGCTNAKRLLENASKSFEEKLQLR
jgi:hypothetical protein